MLPPPTPTLYRRVGVHLALPGQRLINKLQPEAQRWPPGPGPLIILGDFSARHVSRSL